MSICAELFYFFRQIRRGDAQCVCLAGSINISQHEMVGMGERFGKFVEKCFGTCVSVRLENAPYFIVWIMFCSFECYSPLYSKRRSVPEKESSPLFVTSIGISSRSATAIADSALDTL